MAAALMWLLIGTAFCLVYAVCMIPGWIIRKIRERRELHYIRSLYPNVARRRAV